MGKRHYTFDERMAAVKLYIKYDNSPSAVIYELGYPSRGCLQKWYQEYAETGTLSKDNSHMLKYTLEQRETAVI